MQMTLLISVNTFPRRPYLHYSINSIRKKTCVSSEDIKKTIHEIWGQNTEFLFNIRAGNTYSNHCALQGSDGKYYYVEQVVTGLCMCVCVCVCVCVWLCVVWVGGVEGWVWFFSISISYSKLHYVLLSQIIHTYSFIFDTTYYKN